MATNLKNIIDNYSVVKDICSKAMVNCEANPYKYVKDYKLPILGKKSKLSVDDIRQYFDFLQDSILENFYLELFATFENILIEKVRLASGEMKKNIKEHFNEKLPFKDYEDKFVKEENDIGSLNKIVILLEGKIDLTLHSQLSEIVRYRDKLAHGKRFHTHLSLTDIELTFHQMEKILNEI